MVLYMKKSFLFVGDIFETELNLPLNIFDSFYLTKANEDQIILIKQFIDGYYDVLKHSINKFETIHQPNADKGFDIITLPKEFWKYFIIEHDKKQSKPELQIVFSLSEIDLTILFETVYHVGGANSVGKTYNQLRTLNYFHDSENEVPPIVKKIDTNAIEELRNINLLIANFEKNKFPFIQKALTDFVKIKDISESSPFKILNCFSILELLLTTYRQRTSNDSSLSSQLQKKINLVNNQLDNKIQVNNYFKGPDTLTMETMIEKLYQYRNDIAHGNLSNFEKDLSILKNQQKKILPFLFATIKNMLIYSIKYPQLINDLKEC